MKKHLAIICSLCAIALPSIAATKVPVAVVENTVGNVGVEFMDYVTAGQVIDLGAKGSVVLSYMKSCVRETITGGTVIALDEESLVQGGRVERSRPPCDAKRMQLSARQAEQSAGTVYRSGIGSGAKAEPLVLYGRSPMVQIDEARSPLLIRRLDQSGDSIEIVVTRHVLVADRFIDLERAGIALQPGGRYLATIGASEVEFSIDAGAEPGASPVIGRLLRFQ